MVRAFLYTILVVLCHVPIFLILGMILFSEGLVGKAGNVCHPDFFFESVGKYLFTFIYLSPFLFIYGLLGFLILKGSLRFKLISFLPATVAFLGCFSFGMASYIPEVRDRKSECLAYIHTGQFSFEHGQKLQEVFWHPIPYELYEFIATSAPLVYFLAVVALVLQVMKSTSDHQQ